MKVTLTLEPGSIGLGFDGCPVVVRKVVETSPYAASVVPHKMVVRGVTIPGIVQVTGLHMDAAFLIALLKEYSGTVGRQLVLEERPILTSTKLGFARLADSDGTATTTTEPTTFKVELPPGNPGLTFQNAPHWRGPALVQGVDELSPVAAAVVPGLQVDGMEIPDQGVRLESILSAERVAELLAQYDAAESRILHLSMPLNEVTAAIVATTTTPASRFVPLQGSSVVEIVGTQTQMAIVRLTAGVTVHAAPDMFLYSTGQIQETRHADSSATRLQNDERVSLAQYTTVAGKKNATATLALSPPAAAAKIFVLDLEDYGGTIIAGARNFVCTADDRVLVFGYTPGAGAASTGDTAAAAAAPTSSPKSSAGSSSSPKALLLQGNLRMQRIMGKGKVFLTAAGNPLQRTLIKDETLRVATQHLAAYQFGMQLELQGLRGLGSVVTWGQGVATLTGPGTVWMESSSSRGASGGLLDKA